VDDYEPIRIFVGHDRRTPIVYHVACHSILTRASTPVSFTPLAMNALKTAGLMRRPLLSNQSTEFSFSRFLTPYLAGYRGWAIFMDNDVVVLEDIAKLWALRDDRYAVMCVKHDHRPANEIKFLGEVQTTYEKKNWSSVMLMNCARCAALTPDYVNTASGLALHRFHWLGDDSLIGELPPEWNHLVGYSEGRREDQKLLHFTDGGPYYDAYKDCKWADAWVAERDDMLAAQAQSLAEVFPGEVVGA
jgi:hypothetical protein